MSTSPATLSYESAPGDRPTDVVNLSTASEVPKPARDVTRAFFDRARSAFLAVLSLFVVVVGLTGHASADVRVFFQRMHVNDCNEVGVCDWKLSCALGNQQETEFFSMSEANTNEDVTINRVLTQREFPPVTVTCTAMEHDGGIGAEWEQVGTGTVIVNTTGNHLIRINQHRDEGDVTVMLDAQTFAGQPLTAANSLQSVNFPGFFMRHAFFLGEISQIGTPLDRADSTFIVRSGLNGAPGSVSFESVNFPNHFLRHQDFRLKLHPRDESELYRNDATFFPRPGLADGQTTSYESANFPGRFIRHRDFHLWVEGNDGSQLFQMDASFRLDPPNQ
jgi:hypothetical protein